MTSCMWDFCEDPLSKKFNTSEGSHWHCRPRYAARTRTPVRCVRVRRWPTAPSEIRHRVVDTPGSSRLPCPFAQSPTCKKRSIQQARLRATASDGTLNLRCRQNRQKMFWKAHVRVARRAQSCTQETTGSRTGTLSSVTSDLQTNAGQTEP